MAPKDRLFVALDVDSLENALSIVKELMPYVGGFKVGLELLTSEGAQRVVETLHQAGATLFFDGKFNDIPQTVGASSRVVTQWGVRMFDVHASSGLESMKAAVREKGSSLCLAVTVLTSLEDSSCKDIFGDSSLTTVIRLAKIAKKAGVDGIICSSKELEAVHADEELSSLIKVTPGVRPTWAKSDDQKRIMTPQEAIRLGATYLVVGRPILHPPSGSRVEAAQRIVREISEA